MEKVVEVKEEKNEIRDSVCIYVNGDIAIKNRL